VRPASPTRRLLRALACGTAGALLVAGCATTYDETIASEVSAAAEPTTSTTLPVGTAAELLPLLVAEARGLSELMTDGEGDDATSAAMRISQYWDAVKSEVNAARPDLLSDFSANVDRCQTAVQYHRAADADKAAKNLAALAETFFAS